MLIDWLIRLAHRSPYSHLPGYMNRYWLLQARWWFPVSIRVHHILRPDNDRHMHDHPWNFVSVILRGWYIEHLPERQQMACTYDQPPYCRQVARAPGSIAFRRATDRHKIGLVSPDGCITLFFQFGKSRSWGFHTPSGWVYWRTYLGDYRSDEPN